MSGRRHEVFRLNDEEIAQAKAERDAALAQGVSITDYYAGSLTHLYPDPEDTRRFLDDLRGYGEVADPDTEP